MPELERLLASLFGEPSDVHGVVHRQVLVVPIVLDRPDDRRNTTIFSGCLVHGDTVSHTVSTKHKLT